MMLVVTYDVDTTDKAGARRLRRVATLCGKYGRRVQNSVFEVVLDPAQLATLKAGLDKIIRAETDSVRIYRIGSNYQGKIDVMGRKAPIEADEVLLL